jgi:hypothetical protein
MPHTLNGQDDNFIFCMFFQNLKITGKISISVSFTVICRRKKVKLSKKLNDPAGFDWLLSFLTLPSPPHQHLPTPPRKMPCPCRIPHSHGEDPRPSSESAPHSNSGSCTGFYLGRKNEA